MTLNGDLLLKGSLRRFYQLGTIKTIAFIMGIIFLMILVVYNYISITSEHLNELSEYQVLAPTKSAMIATIPTINYKLDGKEQLEAEFLRRGDHVREKCKELGLIRRQYYIPRPNAQEFFINYDYHIIYCSVFKAASTSWLYNMNLLAGVAPETLKRILETVSPMTVARRKYARPLPSELLKALTKNLSFLIVRHPFERLIRTYEDKFILEGDDKFYQEMGEKIIWRTRLQDDFSLLRDGTINQTYLPPSFEELVKFTLCEWKDNKLQDEHWKPITKFCTPCHVPFDYIIKFETLEKEEQVLIERANLQEVLKPRWEDDTSDEKIEVLEQKYFSTLSKQQILELYKYYKADFELFEYSMDKYLAYGQDVPFVSLPCRPLPRLRTRK
ncbi:carbohydrate sulfotransferase 11-like [Fopius arisanus]|uniref:Carbohydrate sulfotransferase n=1 Tax=Fopius arisanus TaxID=64838 RepID=A0A0C9RKF5_9HYME|nr:PREDICTED: carbohydrate sulfotransferase 11-like [Fopius arisanus]